MSEVMTNNGNGAVTVTGGDPYSSYGAKVGLQGNFLTFKNGEFTHGTDARVLPMGTRLAVNMPGLRIGWRRWFGGQLTDDLTELLSEQPQIQRREQLGSDDPALWEKDGDGKPRDPWSLSNVIEFVDGEGERYIYASAAKGAINAIGQLCKEYGKLYRQRPGQVPIIELAADSYMHPVYKKTFVPVFIPIVGWTSENMLDLDGDPDEPPLTGSTPTQGQGRNAQPAQASAPSQDASQHALTTKSRSRTRF